MTHHQQHQWPDLLRGLMAPHPPHTVPAVPPPTISPSGLNSSQSHRSGGDHAFVPLAVGHGAPVVVRCTALVGLLLASVHEGLCGLSLALGSANNVTGTLWSETGGEQRQD